MTVVQVVLDEELSLREAAARFNISNESVVRHWVNVYKDTGEKGLLNIKPGRNKNMKKTKNTSTYRCGTGKVVTRRTAG